jgi:aryl-alcohol dehydrogenase-like predicted oxidoreductase
MNKFCHETGVGLIPWSPLYAGRLARPLSSQETTRGAMMSDPSGLGGISDAEKQIINRVEDLADKKGWKMSHVALAWNIQKDTVPIVGFSSLSRLDEALEVRGKTLTEEEMLFLEEPYLPKPIMGHQ